MAQIKIGDWVIIPKHCKGYPLPVMGTQYDQIDFEILLWVGVIPWQYPCITKIYLKQDVQHILRVGDIVQRENCNDQLEVLDINIDGVMVEQTNGVKVWWQHQGAFKWMPNPSDKSIDGRLRKRLNDNLKSVFI